MSPSQVDLAQVFKTVAQALEGQKDGLNQADDFNHDHGDHITSAFELIAQAVQEKPQATPSEQLAYAGQKLDQSASSGSAKLYAQGLQRAAAQLQGQPAVTESNALSLVQALLGATDLPASTALAPQEATISGGRGVKRKPTPLDSILAAGSAYMDAKKEGASPLETLVKIFVSGGSSGGSRDREESGKIVGQTIIQAIQLLLGQGEDKPEKKPASKPKPKPKTPVKKPAKKPAAKPKTPEKKPAKKPTVKPKPAAKPKPKPKPAAKPKKPSDGGDASVSTKPKPKPKPKPKS